MGGWVSPKADLDVLEKRKIASFAGIRTLDRPARSLVTILTTLPWLIREVTGLNISLDIRCPD
jgi:hypothetical protein